MADWVFLIALGRMIITLAEEFDAFGVEDWTSYLPAVENLLTAHLQGWHLFVPSRNVVAALSQSPHLSTRHKEVLSAYIGERLPTLNGELSSVVRYLMCSTGEDYNSDHDRAGVVPLSAFADLENCFKTRLLVENPATDGEFYTRLAQLMNEDRWTLPVSFDVVHGGGSTTANRAHAMIAQARPGLAIVDGDKLHPHSPEGDTARAVRAAFQDLVYQTQELIVTQVRAAENYIPYDLGSAFLNGRLESAERCALLASVQQAQPIEGFDARSCVTGYFHHRKGLKMAAFRNGNEEFKRTVRYLLSVQGVNLNEPAHNDNSRDSEVIFPPINGQCLELFLRNLSDPAFRKRCQNAFLESSFYDELKHVLDKVIAFGRAPQKSPISLTPAA